MYDCLKEAESLTMRPLNVRIISISIHSPTASRNGSHGLRRVGWPVSSSACTEVAEAGEDEEAMGRVREFSTAMAGVAEADWSWRKP